VVVTGAGIALTIVGATDPPAACRRAATSS
jgi:hypothetical protein